MKSSKSWLRRALAVGVIIGTSAMGAATAAGGDILVREAWVREMPPVSPVTAGYLTLDNKGAAERTLIGGESPYFETVELHRTVHAEGMASMVQQERITIAPGASLEMRPGSYHMMLIGAKQALKAGDTVPLTLLFADGLKVPVSMPVRKADTGSHDHHHH